MSDTPEVDAEAIREEFEAALKQPAGPPRFPLAEGVKVGRVIGVVSGKGGVGKSLVCSILATELSRAGKRVGILDADITGPSIPRIFGLAGLHAMADENENIVPVETAGGIKIVSTNLMLEDEREPVVWRGPVLGGVIQQFWGQCAWGDLDYLLIDMPPGTGDVPLTVFQSLPVDGIVVVTSPQDLVQMVVAKALRMAEMMRIPVLGLVENMAYAVCPHCGDRIELYGESKAEKSAQEAGVAFLGQLGIDPALAAACDQGLIEQALPEGLLSDAIAAVEKL